MFKAEGLREFSILNLIGRGTFSRVFKIQNKKSKQLFAMKVISKEKIKKEKLDTYIKLEEHITQNIAHPFIIKSLFSCTNTHNYFLVMNYHQNKDLASLLQKQT